jgi:hypothetical protein
MKKITALMLGTFLMMSAAFSSFAKESVLIDFDLLKANGCYVQEEDNGESGDGENKGGEWEYSDSDSFDSHFKATEDDRDVAGNLKFIPQHMPTLIDYSAVAGSNYSDEELQAMKVSLSAYNWHVILNSSAATVKNQGFSKCIEWHSNMPNNSTGLFDGDDIIETQYDDEGVGQKLSDKKFVDGDGKSEDGTGFTVLGVRIHFPEAQFNNWALIRPPFEIPAYEDITRDPESGEEMDLESDDWKENYRGKGNKFENGYGVIKNVGAIKSMTVRIYGCQFKNQFGVMLKDQDNIETEIDFAESLSFDGWKKINWTNPNYIASVQNRALHIVPLYPTTEPFIKFNGFRIYRQGDQLGGDFVVYLKDIRVKYDEAVLKKSAPIDHEKAWGILAARTQAAKKREFEKIGKDEILRYLEKQKMDQTPATSAY